MVQAIVRLQPGDVTDAVIGGSAFINAGKLQNTYMERTDFGLAPTATPVTTTKLLHVANNSGFIPSFRALCLETGTAASMTFDLLKNGSSILSAPITITNATGNGVIVDGAIATAAFAEGDIFESVLTVSTSTGAEGPYAWAGIIENGAP